MADFEDATSPTWFNVIDGQLNLYDAVRRQIDFTDETGRRHELGKQPATIMVRPRGWHLEERHLRVDGEPVPGALVDFGLYFFHNALTLIANGRGPYFYLPKLESHHEARLWRDVFSWSEKALGLPQGTIRATCLVETFPAVFEMTEILYELRDYSAGLNAGRWDYLFSMIKNCADDPTRVVPDRDKITMTVPLLRAYTELLVRTCHGGGRTPSAGWRRSCRAAPARRPPNGPWSGPGPTRRVRPPTASTVPGWHTLVWSAPAPRCSMTGSVRSHTRSADNARMCRSAPRI
jgi:malate synthase